MAATNRQLLSACEAALEYMANYAPRTYNDERLEVYAILRVAVDEARRRVADDEALELHYSCLERLGEAKGEA